MTEPAKDIDKLLRKTINDSEPRTINTTNYEEAKNIGDFEEEQNNQRQNKTWVRSPIIKQNIALNSQRNHS